MSRAAGNANSASPPPVLITIDGPAGTGKTTVAHLLASRLGLDFLDTGAMYRAAAWLSIRDAIAPDNGTAIARGIDQAGVRFDWTQDPPALVIGEDRPGEQIRGKEVNAIVSVVAAQSAVREVLVREQQRISSEHPRLVSEGRDQGSVVFPHASLRFYLDADVEVRADRRASQMAAAGHAVDLESVIEEIRRRDHMDMTRSDGPLVRPAGAIDVDTGRKSADEVIDLLASIARERLPEAGFKP